MEASKKAMKHGARKPGKRAAREFDEDEATLPPLPRKRQSKKMASNVSNGERYIYSEEDDEEDIENRGIDLPCKISASKARARGRRAVPLAEQVVADEEEEEEDEDDEEEEGDMTEQNKGPQVSVPGKKATDPIVYGAQRAMALIERICEHLDMRWQGATVRPDDAIWTKIGGTFVRKRHPEYRLTFSSFDSFHGQVGRFVAAMVYGSAELEPKFVPGGAHVWRHGWFSPGNLLPRCMHGTEMVIKPRVVELNPSSEAGKRALAEQNGVMDRNRFGRQVVVLRFDKNVVCYKDQDHGGFPNPHAHGSCAMLFSDAQKALSAMKHDLAWTQALYPNCEKRRAEECVLLSTNCNCNYAMEGPIGGRQLCKMTPFKLSGTEHISNEMCETRSDMQAHKTNPHTMVFTCCNPQSPRGDSETRPIRRGDRTCAWRLSAMDLRYAYVFASELMTAVMGKSLPTNIPEFRWNDKYCYKTDVIAPVCPVESANPFA